LFGKETRGRPRRGTKRQPEGDAGGFKIQEEEKTSVIPQGEFN